MAFSSFKVSAVLLQDCDGSSKLYERLKDFIQENADEICELGREIHDVRLAIDSLIEGRSQWEREADARVAADKYGERQHYYFIDGCLIRT